MGQPSLCDFVLNYDMAVASDHFDNGIFEEEDDRVLERMMIFS